MKSDVNSDHESGSLCDRSNRSRCVSKGIHTNVGTSRTVTKNERRHSHHPLSIAI
jgi:hypothetical protein